MSRLRLRERLGMVRWLAREKRLAGARHTLAFLTVPRHRFVPADQQAAAYAPGVLLTGEEQTLSSADQVALMTGLLAVRPGDRVLEVGTGTGYQAALLAAMGARVTTVEIRPRLHRIARENLTRAGFPQVDARLGDGSLGAPDAGPFDGIVVGCVAPRIPQALLDQLAIGGRLVAPEGDPERIGTLVRVVRTATGFDRTPIRPSWFVPMVHSAADGGLPAEHVSAGL